MAEQDNTTNGAEHNEKTQGNGHDDEFDQLILMQRVPPLKDDDGQQQPKKQKEVWLDPEPLDQVDDAETAGAELPPYPLDALPELVANAVTEYQPFGQQPVPLIAGSALAMVSLVCQPFADVARDGILCGPIGLYVITVGVSGERKTVADRHFTRGAAQWLHRHRAERLQSDRELFLFYQDVTPEKLATGLHERWPSAGLFTNEAALVIGSHAVTETAMRFFGLLNLLWDGSPFSRERQTGGSVHLAGRRFSAHLAMQPVVLRELLAAGDGVARAVGLLARFLITWPESTLGTRVYREPPKRMPALDKYNQRIIELLDAQLTERFPVRGDPTAALTPEPLALSRQAKQCWVQFHNEIERELGEKGRYGGIADIGAKSAENAVRLAAVHYIFEGGEAPGDIPEGIMEKSIRLGRWYLDEAKRALGIGEIAPLYADAILLSRWASRRNVGLFPAREVLRSAPLPLRQIERRDAALDLLVEAHHLHRLSRGGRAVYSVNPKLCNFYEPGARG
jgi:hypothetical protein